MLKINNNWAFFQNFDVRERSKVIDAIKSLSNTKSWVSLLIWNRRLSISIDLI